MGTNFNGTMINQSVTIAEKAGADIADVRNLILKYDEDGNVVDQWTSDGKVHSIEGLVVGKTYTLSETVTSKDYVKATDIKFTVKNSSELETVTMKDKQVSFTKQMLQVKKKLKVLKSLLLIK